LYALKYPQNVLTLVLASPAGIPEGEIGAMIKSDNLTLTQRALFSTFTRLWESGYTPQGAVRATGPVGRNLVRSYTTRRFPNLQPQDADDLYEYLSAITALEGAGEYALQRLLKPGAYAKRPLADRLDQLQMKTVFVYGDRDWMDPTIPLCKLQLKSLHPESRLEIIKDAGHQLFLDNSDSFNSLLISILSEDLVRLPAETICPPSDPFQ
jgi:cardiolipin-specific phospholipase